MNILKTITDEEEQTEEELYLKALEKIGDLGLQVDTM